MPLVEETGVCIAKPDIKLAMRMFALVTDAFGGEGGIAQYNRDFFEAFSKACANNQVTVIPRVAKKKIGDLPQNVKQTRPIHNILFYALDTFVALKKRGPFDIIFCGHLHLLPLSALLAKFLRMPMWLQIHGIEAWKKPSPIFRWAAEQAILVTAVSRHTRRKFLSWANILPNRVRVLPNTIQNSFTPGPKSKNLVARYGLQGKKVLLTVGRMSVEERYKGHDKIIEVLPTLLQKYSNLIYLIAGDGDDLPRLESIVKDKSLERSVLFIGKVKDEGLPDLYRTADLFVMPSSGEGFGIVFLEAMACGTPVVGGTTDGSMDPLHNGMIGTVTPDEKLAESIENALISEPQDRHTVSHFVQQYFGKNAFTKHLSQLTSMITNNI